ncbi:MAG: toluene tolerance protein [Gammaproteobacteria bacterium]|nr:toluene tolerance protein [Gammaproteobacteria bacterium]
MHKLDHQNYLKLRENCKVIEQDGFGDKVMILQDGSFLKLFRRKRLISSAAIWPYAQRFADNAKKLEELGIPCPKIIQVYRIPSIERDAVHYYPLPGTTLRDLYRGDLEYPADLRERFLKFVEHIQDLGVYFRSIHLGNVVLTPGDELGLIDISDMKIFRRPLSKWQRKRNFEHMVKDSNDREWLSLINQYFQHAHQQK